MERFSIYQDFLKMFSYKIEIKEESLIHFVGEKGVGCHARYISPIVGTVSQIVALTFTESGSVLTDSLL